MGAKPADQLYMKSLRRGGVNFWLLKPPSFEHDPAGKRRQCIGQKKGVLIAHAVPERRQHCAHHRLRLVKGRQHRLFFQRDQRLLILLGGKLDIMGLGHALVVEQQPRAARAQNTAGHHDDEKATS